jgi:hypothetical protein
MWCVCSALLVGAEAADWLSLRLTTAAAAEVDHDWFMDEIWPVLAERCELMIFHDQNHTRPG